MELYGRRRETVNNGEVSNDSEIVKIPSVNFKNSFFLTLLFQSHFRFTSFS